MKISRTIIAFTVSLMVFLTACAKDTEIRIVTISSVNDVLKDIIKAYKKENPDSKVRLTIKSSGGMGIHKDVNSDQSIMNIIILTDSEWLNGLKSSNKVRDVEPFGRNAVLLVGSKNAIVNNIANPPQLVPLISRESKLGISNPETGTLGQETVNILKYYNMYEDLRRNLTIFSSSSNTLQGVEIGQVDYAFVFRTDALTSYEIKTLYVFPQESYAPITYSIGAVSYNYEKSSAKFLKFVRSDTAIEILDSYGFL
jgi:molybdate transport system substrate-binding protein